jgi:hypothetical protein
MDDTRPLLAGHWDEPELARQVKRSERTVKRWRKKREGPPYTFVGKTPYYNIESIRAWLRSREVRPVRERGRRRKVKSAPAAKVGA